MKNILLWLITTVIIAVTFYIDITNTAVYYLYIIVCVGLIIAIQIIKKIATKKGTEFLRTTQILLLISLGFFIISLFLTSIFIVVASAFFASGLLKVMIPSIRMVRK